MTLSEILSIYSEKIRRYLRDLITFIRRPADYISLAVLENSTDTFQRLGFYAILAATVELYLFAPVVGLTDAFPLNKALGVAVVETAISLFWLPVLIPIAYLLRLHHPVKSALVYAITSRFTYFVLPIVFYALFLETENYVFAAIKGLATIIAALACMLLFPLALAAHLRQRIICTLAAAGLFLVLLSIWFFLVLSTQTPGEKLVKLSPLYDPIGAEVDKIPGIFGQHPESEPIEQAILLLRELVEHAKSTKDPRAIETLAAQWVGLWTAADSQWTERKKELRAMRTTSKFSTTRQFIDMELRELDQNVLVARRIHELMVGFSDTGKAAFLRDSRRLGELRLENAKAQNRHLAVRAMLARMGLIAY